MKRPPTPTTRIPGADHGFTMIELLMTITVAGILLGIAMPAFRSFVLNDRDIGQINSLVSSLNYARSEAIKLASPTGITVCPSALGLACDPGSTAWSLGWIVIDTNAADCAPAAACTPLQTVPALAGSNTVTPVGGAATGITFSSSGLVAGPPGTTLTIRVCDTRGAAYARDVEVNATGRVAASQTPGQSVTGAALVCP
jgi:type IV fimbrial biogenesis protein FimT